jgi:hypothetical protein
MRPSWGEESLGHWRCILEGDFGTLKPSSFFIVLLSREISSFLPHDSPSFAIWHPDQMPKSSKPVQSWNGTFKILRQNKHFPFKS